MKKFFSFLFALVLAAGAVTGVTLLASAANGGGDDAVVMLLDANVTVTSWDELKAAIGAAANGDVIALENDIEVAAGEQAEKMSIVRANITIDLCGHTINVTGKGYDSGAPDLFVVDEGYTFTLTSSAVDGNGEPINGGIKTNDGTSMHIVSTTGTKSNNLTWNISNIDIEGFGALNEGTSDPYGLIYYYGTPTKTNINIENVNFKNNRALCIAINGSTTNGGGTTIKSSSFENNVIDGYRWGMVAYIDCPGNAEITGLTVKNNGDSAVTSTTKYSSGMSTVYINKANDVMVSGCDFENNISYAGGAFRVDKSKGSTAITDNIVKNNQSGDHSGGFYVTNCQNKVEVSNNNISENCATTYAGGFYVTDGEGELSISENTFTKNKAGSYAGAFRVNNQSGEIEISGNEFSENEATTYAGAFRISDSSSDITISKNEIVENKAGSYAGGFYLGYDTGEIEIAKNTISKNTAETNAGGFDLANNTGDIEIAENEISENTAATFAGGFYETSTAGNITVSDNEISKNTASDYAGGMRFYNTGGTVTVEDNTITENTATIGGGMYFNSIAQNIDIKDNAVTKNTGTSTSTGGGGIYMTSVTGDVSLQKNTISENTAAVYGGALYVTGGNGKLSISENTFTKNKAGSYAGAFRINNQNGDINVSGNEFSENEATTYAGAFRISDNSSNVTVEKNKVTENRAGSYAGGFFLGYNTGDINISENEISKNTAETTEGGFYVANTTGAVAVSKNDISENTAGTYAGGFYLTSNTGEITVSENDVKNNAAGSYAAGFYLNGSSNEESFEITNNTITGNTAGTYAGGAYISSISSGITATGNEITGNTANTYAGGILLGTNTVFTMESGAIYGNTANSYAADVYNTANSEFTLIKAEDMDVTDYSVKGWYNDAEDARYAETENPAEYTVKSGDTSGQSLVAAYGCTLSYDAGLGKGTIDSAFMDITKGEESVTVSSADGMTMPKGYCRFGSWNLAPDGSDETSYSPDSEITLTKNTTLYAQWDKHNFSTEKAEDETDEDGYEYIEFNWCDDDNDLEHLNQITCSATFTCTDCDYTETRDCSVTWEHNEYATCTDAGDYDVKATAHITNPRDSAALTATMDEFFEEIALGHDYGEPIFNWEWDEINEKWTCATATLECSRDDTAEKTHSLTEECTVTSVTTDPTCTEAGETVYTATVHFALDNNDSYVEPLATPVKYTDTKTVEIDALGHTPSTEVVIEKYIAPTCEKNGSYDSVIYCEVCSEEVSREHKELEAIGHAYGEGVVTKEPTCTEEGELTYTCQNDEEHTYTEVIEATGHTAVTDPAVEPTCTEPGLTEGSHCSVCNETIVAQKVIPANGHTPVTDEAVEPTCTETGLTEGSHCSVCNETIVAQEKIPANGHKPLEAVVENYVEPTCTENGSYDSVIYCETCDEELSRDPVEVDALGHTAATDPAVEPTCTEPGLTEGSHCSVCNEVLVAQTEIPALGHNLEYTEAKASSATISGNTEYWYCSVCNKYYADEACTTEISLEDTVIPPTGLVLLPVEVTDVETGEIITVYYDESSGIYYADSEGIIVIHPDSIIPHDSSISVTEEQTTEEVTEQEVTTEGNTGSAENDNGTVNESSVVQLDEEPDEDMEDEEEPDEDEENEDGVKANGSSTSPATGMTADILGGSASLAALVAVFAILSRRNKKKAK